jgi:hypothetical protein
MKRQAIKEASIGEPSNLIFNLINSQRKQEETRYLSSKRIVIDMYEVIKACRNEQTERPALTSTIESRLTERLLGKSVRKFRFAQDVSKLAVHHRTLKIPEFRKQSRILYQTYFSE